MLVCLGCSLMFKADGGGVATASHRDSTPAAVRLSKGSQGLIASAIVAGAVSAIVASLAPQIGAFASGAVASAPLIAATVALRLHGDEGGAAARDFLSGYLDGMAPRTAVMAWIGALAHPTLSVWAPLGLITLLALIVGPRLQRVRRSAATNEVTCRP